jgi:hypothetical protein
MFPFFYANSKRREAKRREASHIILIPNLWIRRRGHFSYPKLKNVLALEKSSKIAVILNIIFHLLVETVFPSPHVEQYQIIPKTVLRTSGPTLGTLIVPTGFLDMLT